MENLQIIWRMREQCVPGAPPPSASARDEANHTRATYMTTPTVILHMCCSTD